MGSSDAQKAEAEEKEVEKEKQKWTENVAEGGLGLGEHDVGVPGGAVAGPGQCGQGQAVVAPEVCDGGVSSEIKQTLKCSAVLKSRVRV